MILLKGREERRREEMGKGGEVGEQGRQEQAQQRRGVICKKYTDEGLEVGTSFTSGASPRMYFPSEVKLSGPFVI